MSPARPASSHSQADRFPRWLSVRLFVYLVGGHLFAAFLWLLFALGGNG